LRRIGSLATLVLCLLPAVGDRFIPLAESSNLSAQQQSDFVGLPLQEAEPNDTADTANAIPPQTNFVSGTISPRDIDFYSFNASRGDRVFVSVEGDSRLTPDLALDLRASDGKTVIASDDDHGPVANSPGLAGVVLPETGKYFLRLRDVKPNDPASAYRLFLCAQSGAAVAESEPNNSFETATPITFLISGSIAASGDVDFYSFTASKDDTVMIAIDDDPERDGRGELDAVLTLFGSDGAQIAQQDLNVEGPGEPEFLNITALPSNGAYFITVSDFKGNGDPKNTYNLSLCIVRATPPNSAPAFGAVAGQRVAVGQRLQFNVTATDADSAQALTLTISSVRFNGAPINFSSLGASFTQSGTNPATGVFSWTPGQSQVGSYDITFTATDNGTPPLSVNLPVNIVVSPQNRAPAFNTVSSQKTAVGKPLQFSITATDQDSGQTLALRVSSASLNGAPINFSSLGASFTQSGTNPATGVFSWTPGQSQVGSYDITFTATDNGEPSLSANLTVNIIVFLPGDADGSGTINVQDLIRLIQVLQNLAQSTPGADCNSDGNVDVQDLICLITLLVQG